MSQMANVFSLLAFGTAYLPFRLNHTTQFSLESLVWQIILATQQCFSLSLLSFPSHIVCIFPIVHNLEFFVQLKPSCFCFPSLRDKTWKWGWCFSINILSKLSLLPLLVPLGCSWLLRSQTGGLLWCKFTTFSLLLSSQRGVGRKPGLWEALAGTFISVATLSMPGEAVVLCLVF